MTVDLDRLLGHFTVMGDVVEVGVVAGELAMLWPGVPVEYAVKMSPTAHADEYRLRGGPAHGAIARFVAGRSADLDRFEIAGFASTRCPAPDPTSDQPGTRHPAPQMVPDPDREAAFAALWSEVSADADGALLDYDLPYPKHEFLRYLESLDAVIFHGSGDPDIDEFRPSRRSIELNDPTGRGNEVAIYGTHDALWPLFFAIIDRERLEGSIRNGVDYFSNDAGDQLAGYHFSVNRLQLAERPYRTGVLYVLPRAPFRRLEHAPGVLANEWASDEPVRPITRMLVEPGDFPFLDRIAGHDDSAIIDGQRLSGRMLAAVVRAREVEEELVMELAWSEEIAGIAIAFVEATRSVLPTARLTLTFAPHDGPVTLAVAGPNAYLAGLERDLGDRLTVRTSAGTRPAFRECDTPSS